MTLSFASSGPTLQGPHALAVGLGGTLKPRPRARAFFDRLINLLLAPLAAEEGLSKPIFECKLYQCFQPCKQKLDERPFS